MKPTIGEIQWQINGPSNFVAFVDDEADAREYLETMASRAPELDLCRFTILKIEIVDDIVFAHGKSYTRDDPAVSAYADKVFENLHL